MEGREGIGLSGSAPYYLNREVSGSGHNPGSFFGSGSPVPTGFKNLVNPGVSIQGNVRDGDSSHVGSSYQVEIRSPNFGGHGVSIGGVSSGDSVSVKKKRGRPRKYGPGGTNVSLALSPMSSDPSPGSNTPGERKNRGRPRGSGRKQRLADLGEWMNSSAGMAFTPHVIHILAGEDIASKILSFAQQRPRVLCILSANGAVSAVTLRQPTSSSGTITYEGRFEILCLSGSYFPSEEGGPRNRTGGLSISFCSPDGMMLGGAIGGRLIAASFVQAVVCSFVYGADASKPKSITEADPKAEPNSDIQSAENSSAPATADTSQYHAPSSGMAMWSPGSQSGVRDPKTEIDLTRG